MMFDRPGLTFWLHAFPYWSLATCLTTIGLSLVAGWFATAGVVASLGVAIWWCKRTIFLKAYSTQTHKYTARHIGGGTLSYIGHVPVLTLSGDSSNTDQETHYVRSVDEFARQPILVVNWRYPDCVGGSFNSAERTHLLKRFFSTHASQGTMLERVTHALALRPYVNSWITLQSLVFRPSCDHVSVSWNNSYAASETGHELSLTQVFR